MKTINVYNFNELSQDAKKVAIEKFRGEGEVYLEFFNDDCIGIIEQRGFFGNIKLQYSLSYCQGDGLSFSCDFIKTKILQKLFKEVLGEAKNKTIQLIIDNCYFNLVGNTGHYCYANSRDLEFRFDDNINAPNIEEVVGKVEDKLRELYLSLCKELEKQGYDEIEFQNSDECIVDLLEANDYEFLEDGQLI
jgi:hypothetical protein